MWPWAPACAGTNGEWLANRSILYHPPLDRLAAPIDQRLLVRPVNFDLLRRRPARLLEGDRLLVGRKLVVPGAVQPGEGLELVEGAVLLEHRGVARDRPRGIEDAGDAVERELLRHRMRRRVGAEEVTRLARSRGLAQRIAVPRGLDDRHHVHVGLEPPAEPIG